MDKNAIKKYAVWARRELIEKVSQKALQYGIENCVELDSNAESINGVLLSETEKKQRQALINKIKIDGYSQVIEEVAYTWFNRFIALRFMEVNGYLPSHVRIFTNEEGLFAPQIMAEALHLDFKSIDRDLILEMKQNNRDDELFRYLIIAQCNELNSILPGMFQKIEDYTGLLLPDYLLRPGSVVEQMITLIPESDWTDQVQIIGWMYQYYISEPKDERINARKKYVNNDISYVTQLFTSEWIVKFMAQNSLGKLWAENYNSNLANGWEYYLSSQVKEHRNTLTPMDIKCIDPCCGSGHILSYIFDLMVQIYEEYGYSTRDAVPLIVEKNIYGLDIDERAAQLAYFSIMMKARQYDRRFFSRGIQPSIFSIKNSNSISEYIINYFADGDEGLKKSLLTLIDEFNNAKIYGSLIRVSKVDCDALFDRMKAIESDISIYKDEAIDTILPLLNVAKILSNHYQVVITNPPYMNASLMPEELKQYVQDNYSDFRSDLFASFTERVVELAETDGHIGLLMPYVWMFISSYEKMRAFLNKNTSISALVQLEYNAFEAACVPVAALTAKKSQVHELGEYIKLSEFRGAENQAPKTIEAVKNPSCGYRFKSSQDDFEKLPGKIFAFWASKNVIDSFAEKSLGTVLTTREGMATADNESFLRLWSEVDINKIGFSCSSIADASGYKWFPYNKGGDYRKWYGNNDYIVNWENDGFLIRNNKDPKTGRIRSHNYNGEFAFKKGITWSALSSSSISVRYVEEGFLFDSKGAKGFCENENELLYSLGLINSKVGLTYLSFISPTIDFKVGDIIQIPLIHNRVDEVVNLVKRCIEISKDDWDSFETSWNFKRHPLASGMYIEKEFERWKKECEDRFEELKSCEERINDIFINTYGLDGEISSMVNDKDIVIRLADRERDIKSLISYMVGCLFGRYSIDEDGVAYAGGKWNADKYINFKPDDDNIIPICDDEYFSDDIVNRFVSLLSVIYGSDSLNDNMAYIAEAIGGKGTPREVIRNYFLNDFYKDHCSMYAVTGAGKRPIYWQFDSGKRNGFKCLIYVHRYKADTVARIRTDYVHEQQARYRTAIEEIEKKVDSVSQSEKIKLNKQLKDIKDQSDELHQYEEKVHHLADQMIELNLDDGFKKNYALFGDVLSKVK
jgi:type II restriction/modification system DNA methylase subunit YeeA